MMYHPLATTASTILATIEAVNTRLYGQLIAQGRMQHELADIRRAYDLRLAELELNLSEASALAYTQESGPLMQAELARRLGVGRAAMGVVIDSLERRGLVERQAKQGDRRVWMISVTPAGDDLVQKLLKIDESLRGDLRAGISRKERRELTQLLVRLRVNVEGVISQT